MCVLRWNVISEGAALLPSRAGDAVQQAGSVGGRCAARTAWKTRGEGGRRSLLQLCAPAPAPRRPCAHSQPRASATGKPKHGMFVRPERLSLQYERCGSLPGPRLAAMLMRWPRSEPTGEDRAPVRREAEAADRPARRPASGSRRNICLKARAMAPGERRTLRYYIDSRGVVVNTLKEHDPLGNPTLAYAPVPLKGGVPKSRRQDATPPAKPEAVEHSAAAENLRRATEEARRTLFQPAPQHQVPEAPDAPSAPAARVGLRMSTTAECQELGAQIKAAAMSEEWEQVQTLLCERAAEMVVCKRVLADSGVGRIVNRLLRVPELQEAARDVLDGWKFQVSLEDAPSRRLAGAVAVDTLRPPQPDGSPPPSPQRPPAVEQPQYAASEPLEDLPLAGAEAAPTDDPLAVQVPEADAQAQVEEADAQSQVEEAAVLDGETTGRTDLSVTELHSMLVAADGERDAVLAALGSVARMALSTSEARMGGLVSVVARLAVAPDAAVQHAARELLDTWHAGLGDAAAAESIEAKRAAYEGLEALALDGGRHHMREADQWSSDGESPLEGPGHDVCEKVVTLPWAENRGLDLRISAHLRGGSQAVVQGVAGAAAEAGTEVNRIEVGDELVAVNGRMLATLTPEETLIMLRERTSLALRLVCPLPGTEAIDSLLRETGNLYDTSPWAEF